jgi:hypothetical protein
MTKVIEQAENSRRSEDDSDSKYENEKLFNISERGLGKLSPDACLIQAYIKSSKGLHVRRTLD